jgi:hypothetical protein
MTNAATHTGINAGELSEAVLAVEAVVRQTGRTREDVVDLALGATDRKAQIDGVELLYDGKSEAAINEIKLNLADHLQP